MPYGGRLPDGPGDGAYRELDRELSRLRPCGRCGCAKELHRHGSRHAGWCGFCGAAGCPCWQKWQREPGALRRALEALLGALARS